MTKKRARKSTRAKPSARAVMRALLQDGGVSPREVDAIVDGLGPFLRKAAVKRAGGEYISPSPIARRKGSAFTDDPLEGGHWGRQSGPSQDHQSPHGVYS